MPCGEAYFWYGAMTCRVHLMSGQREVLPDHALRRSVKVFEWKVVSSPPVRRTRAGPGRTISSVIEGSFSPHHTAALVVSGYRSPLIQETAYVEHDVMRPSGELPTAGQRRGRERSIWWGQAELEGCVVGGKAGVPPFEVLAKTAVDDADSHLKQKVCTLRRPTHLLRFRHALVDDLVDGRLHERGLDALTHSIPTAIVG